MMIVLNTMMIVDLKVMLIMKWFMLITTIMTNISKVMLAKLREMMLMCS